MRSESFVGIFKAVLKAPFPTRRFRMNRFNTKYSACGDNRVLRPLVGLRQ